MGRLFDYHPEHDHIACVLDKALPGGSFHCLDLPVSPGRIVIEWLGGPREADVRAVVEAQMPSLGPVEYWRVRPVEELEVGVASVAGRFGLPLRARWHENVVVGAQGMIEASYAICTLPLAGRTIEEWVEAVLAGETLPDPTADDVAAWLASQDPDARLAGLRAAGTLPPAPNASAKAPRRAAPTR